MDDIDRISQLPEAIAHHILSFLKSSPKELVRMSVLSKDWFTITAAFPILDFDIDSYIVLSVSSLSSLIIQNCESPSSLMVDNAIKFKSLKMLRLDRVAIDEQVIERLTTCCPLLEKFMLLKCHGFKRFCINGFQNLEQVALNFNNEVERIYINAPNLWYLFLVDRDQRGAPCMNLIDCKKLTTLSYRGNPLPKMKGSANFLSNFPYIENLFLATLQPNLKISSLYLETVALCPCCDLDLTNIDAPNLVLFKYSISSSVSELLVRNSSESEAQMEWFPTHDVNALWFKKLRRFLNKTSGFFKVLKLNICSSSIDVEELKVIDSPPFQLEHVEVELGTIKDLPVYVAAVDAVLWCLRPQTLTLKSDFQFLDFEQRSHIVKFTHEKLLQQNDEGRTDIQIELSISSSKAKEHFNDLNSLLAALPHDPLRHIITFTKVEDSNAV